MSCLGRIDLQAAGFEPIETDRWSRFVVRRSWVERFRAEGWLDPGSVLERGGEGDPRGRFLRRLEVGPADDRRACFVKEHRGGGLRRVVRDRLRAIRRPSRAFCELEHLLRLERLGIPTAPAVAAAEVRRAGVEVRSLLVTDSIEASIPLVEIFASGGGSRSAGEGFRRKRRLLTGLARQVAEFHQAGIVWPDLLAKHCLVDPESDAIRFLDLERMRPRARSGREVPARDLAALGLTFDEPVVTRGDRLRFLIAYAREARTGTPRDWLLAADEHARALAGRRSRYRWYLDRPPRVLFGGSPRTR